MLAETTLNYLRNTYKKQAIHAIIWHLVSLVVIIISNYFFSPLITAVIVVVWFYSLYQFTVFSKMVFWYNLNSKGKSDTNV